MVRNGFFLFDVRDDGTYVTIIPPDEGGKPVTVENIVSFLNAKKIENFSIPEINKGLAEISKNPSFKITDTVMAAANAFCIYDISSDNMTVTATMMPEVLDGDKMSINEIIGDLQVKKITFGIDEEIIKELVENDAYNTTVVVARGEPVIQGKDGRIEYLFDTKPVPKPTVDETGKVDFHDLNLINKVSAGDVVARIIPKVDGIPGHNVTGAVIVPNKVNRVVFKYNKNLRVSEDGLELIADVSGHISLEGDKVFVNNTYEVPVDVDVTTGDINYDGNILVHGNIRAGFSVKATGDITVSGVVEGAKVEAGGDLIIGRGVQGMNKAVLYSGRNTIVKFVENATVSCEGDLETDTLLHSNVTVGGTVTALGKNGHIIGGNIRAGKKIVAKDIGNLMGTVTDISIGVDPNVKNRLTELTNSIKKINDDKVKVNQAIVVLKKKLETEGKLDAQKMELLQKSIKSFMVFDEQLKAATEEYRELQQKLCEDVDACVKISRSIYPGVKLTFGSSTLFIKDRNDYCQYVKRGADITRLPL